ncbi:MAG: PAS domain-containing protein [Deltaproteobacteria bacterium]|nr:PAS domain-containing protein [Deltaproteobacteria bacterium]
MTVQVPTHSTIARACAHSLTAAMLRDLDGNIIFWNRAAERSYRISERKALGSVSHVLLHTVFPEPLSEINRQLLKTGKWTGELIHTLPDGQKVKVRSSWELAAEDCGACVIETNTNFTDLDPQSAHLGKPLSLSERFIRILLEHKLWWIIPFIFLLLVAEFFTEFAPSNPMLPLPD